MRSELAAVAARHSMCNYACTGLWHASGSPPTCPAEGCGARCGLQALLRVLASSSTAVDIRALQDNLAERHLCWVWITKFLLQFIRGIHTCQAYWCLSSDSAFFLDSESDALKAFQTFLIFIYFLMASVDYPPPPSPLYFVWSLAPGHSPWRIASSWVLNSSDVVSCDSWHLNSFR